jgi:tRNA threonylcarbamoyladenosine biosynthesis protein TsaE
MLELESSSPEETERIAAALAGKLEVGDVVTVAGELGTGKTTFVRGACRALGVVEPVTSPTFTIGQLYGAVAGLEVAHLDLYRLETLAGEDPALLADYVTPDRVAFVEWPGVAEPGLGGLAPDARVAARVRIEHRGGDTREIEVDEPAASG